ncbi:MAG: cytochrome b/b6 domain-containing protein [Hyphomonas sp.]|uniref:cytochrome b/b6 domain-containing protein n=1 Tax=Hyphomonas sp. TaxID=87 RepID=UPI003527822B
MSASSSRYTTVAILLHWALAFLLIFMIWLGWNMEDNASRFQLHKSVGISILVLTVARILWRGINPPPPLPEEMSPREKTLSHLVHKGMYALMLLLPFLGWFLVSTSSKPVPTVLFDTVRWPHLPFTEGLRGGVLHEVAEFLHSKGAWVLIILLVLHVAGAVKHEIAAEEGVLKRMLPGLFGKASPPARRGRGYVTAFGGALVFFGIIAAIPLLKSAGATPPPQLEAEADGMVSNWEINSDASEIAFAGQYEGAPFNGTFGAWSASIYFDPDDLEGSSAEVVVSPGSAATGKKLYDDSLAESEWFDVSTYPTAKVHLTNFQTAGSAYRADATLLVKEHAVTVPLDFEVTITGDTATFSGTAVLSRKALNLGQASDPGGDWVGDEVTVTVSGAARRK